MPKVWDRLMKMLVEANPQHLINWLVEGARLTDVMSREMTARAVEADILYIVTVDGQEMVLHVEFQRRSDRSMGKRLWEYNTLATFISGLPTYSIVVYLKKDRKVAVSPYEIRLPTGEVIHRFYYQVIKLWEIESDTLKQPGLEGLLPLLPLTRNGARYEVVDEMIEALIAADKKDLLALGYAFAGLVLESDADKAWLKRRFEMLEDILEESWSYQEMVQKGLMKGMEKGLEQGLEQGLKQGLEQGLKQGRQEERQRELQKLRQMLFDGIENRFPDLLPLAKRCADAVNDPDTLQNVILRTLLVSDASEARRHLFEVIENKNQQ